jgi:hypothetical protein
MAAADPEMVKEYARRGHTVGTHTWSHANLAHLGAPKARAELEMGFSAVQQAMGKPIAPFFRFPYLSSSTSMANYLHGRQIATFSIDVDSKDYRTRDPGSVYRMVMGQLARTRKGIILFHDIQPSTAKALPSLLADLKAKGYRIVHLVPKAPVATVSEFDAIVQSAAEKKTAGGVGPLRRSVTWSVPLPPELAGSQESGADQTQTTPGQKPADPATPTRAPRRGGAAEEDWKAGLWRSY